MMRKIGAALVALALGFGGAALASPAYADEVPPVEPTDVAVVQEETPAPVETSVEVVPEATPAEVPAEDPAPEPESFLRLVPEVDSVVDVDFVLLAWYAAGGPPPNHFDVPQTLSTSLWMEDPNLNALDGWLNELQAAMKCEVTETYQLDLELDNDTTTALIAIGILNGPGDPPESHAYGYVDGNPWKFVTLTGPECIATYEPPTFEDYCVTKGSDDVGWKVTGADDTEQIDWMVEVDTASHRVRAVAVAISPYSLASGEDKDVYKWDYTDTTCVTPKPPIFHDECGVSCDWFKIPGKFNGEGQWNSYHGYYTVQDNRIDGVGQVKVVFHPNQNVEVNEPGEGDTYHLYNGKAVWKFDFTAVDCIIEDIPGEVTFHEECGTDKDTYTIPEVPEGAHWHYEVDGSPVDPGVYAGNGSVTVEAVADDGWAFPEEVTTSWSHDFTNVACPTPPPPGLAATGGSISWGGFALAVLAIAAGIGFTAIRIRRGSLTEG